MRLRKTSMEDSLSFNTGSNKATLLEAICIIYISIYFIDIVSILVIVCVYFNSRYLQKVAEIEGIVTPQKDRHTTNKDANQSIKHHWRVFQTPGPMNVLKPQVFLTCRALHTALISYTSWKRYITVCPADFRPCTHIRYFPAGCRSCERAKSACSASVKAL